VKNTGWVGGCCPHGGLDHDGEEEGAPCTVPGCFGKVCKGWQPGAKQRIAKKPQPKGPRKPSRRAIFTRDERLALGKRVRDIVDAHADPKTVAARRNWEKRHPKRTGWGRSPP